MSIFKKLLIESKKVNKSILKGTFLAGTVLFSSIAQDTLAKGKSYVAVEPLTCDLVKSIALPSDEVRCIVDRKADVHDLKITPRQAQALNNADMVFTLGKEMTPAMRNWESKPQTVVIGVSAVNLDDHSDHEGHDDHSDHSSAKKDDHSDHEGHDDHSDHSSAKKDDHSDHSDHEGHDDHAKQMEGSFEWAGKFNLSKGTYKWSFAKVDGEYADPAMKMVILKSNDIESSEQLAKDLLGSNDSISKSNNGTLKAANKAFLLNFSQKKEVTSFDIEIKETGEYTFFTEHMPFEFEANEHFFKDVTNNDVEPIAQVPDEGEGHHHHDHGGIDPHIWHDPHNITKMGEVISKNLKKDISIFNRSDKNLINERFETVDSIIEDLDSWIVKQVSTIPESNRIIVSKHNAMGYYGNAFGFETISLLDTLGESSSLRPEKISAALKELKKDNVKVLFSEQKPVSKLIKNLSRQSSIPISSDQIHSDGLMMTGNTVSVAIHNTCTIVNSLGGTCDKEAGSNLENTWNSLQN